MKVIIVGGVAGGATAAADVYKRQYDIDIEADDINVIDTATVIWEIA